jgi:DNA polymerase I-like protein with 3'-5' exonuclease and polymerase domains
MTAPFELELPNVREMFQPDEGKYWFDADLSGADAMVVAWDAEDDDLKAAFRARIDVHEKNCDDLFPNEWRKLVAEARDAEPNSKPARAKHQFRQDNKKAVHATNYLTTARNLAAHLGWLVIDAERFIARWFSLHPAIARWHKRKAHELATRGYIDCAFPGYRRIFYDRPDSILPEAVAWTPQATVALVTQKAILAVDNWIERENIHDKRGEILDPWCLQVHDSLDFQLYYEDLKLLPSIGENMLITVPYEDPLVIPWGLKMSAKSWGEVRKCDWTGKLK